MPRDGAPSSAEASEAPEPSPRPTEPPTRAGTSSGSARSSGSSGARGGITHAGAGGARRHSGVRPCSSGRRAARRSPPGQTQVASRRTSCSACRRGAASCRTCPRRCGAPSTRRARRQGPTWSPSTRRTAASTRWWSRRSRTPSRRRRRSPGTSDVRGSPLALAPARLARTSFFPALARMHRRAVATECHAIARRLPRACSPPPRCCRRLRCGRVRLAEQSA